MQFFSQVGQDQYLFNHFFYGKRNGVFVDVGAYDGEKFSNSLFFERYMGWTGLCVEPLPSAFAKLKATRKAACERVCLADFEGEADFTESDDRVDEKMLSGMASNFDPRHIERLKTIGARTVSYKMPVRRLSSLLEQYSLHNIDYCSIDTEGSELAILSELDFERFNIATLTIENNYSDDRVPRLMMEKGYDLIDKLEQDYVFKRKGLAQLPQTSVFCAVWHGDPKREETLRGHVANLARQTVPVRPIYVFDGGDQPPPWLDAATISVRDPLTIYQAWNIALSMADTRFVMNLNLDDRLAPNAVEQMQKALEQNKAVIVGGDWRICYSQEETDDVSETYPADRLPFVSAWPPLAGTRTRLGSGTGNRGTFGPATMWRLDAHLKMPRYPWRFTDGTLIRSAADAMWWTAQTTILKSNYVKLPIIIGNYHSHPHDQAEFRKLPHDEMALMSQVGFMIL